MSAVTQNLQEARQLYKQGHFEQAWANYRAILDSEPNNLEALQVLGDIAYKTGKLNEAKTYLKKALDQAPNHAKVLNVLGLVSQSEQNFDEALSYFQQAMQLQPNLPDVCNNIGSVYQALGQLEKAEYYYRLALEHDPEMPEALNNLGFILQLRGFPHKSIPLYTKALEKLPNNLIILMNLGKCYRLNREYKEAIDVFKKALALDPDNADLMYSLGSACMEIGRWNEAERLFDMATERVPDSVEIVASRAYLTQKRNEPQKAREMIEPYCQTHRNNFNLAIRFSDLSHHTGEQQAAINWLEELLCKETLTHRQKQLLYFTLGKLYDSIEQYDSAFRCYRSGNLMHNKTFPVDQFEKVVNQIILQFSQERINQLPKSTNSSDRPIFIVGMLRSGTTLVAQILASHSQVHVGGELTYIDELSQSLHKRLNTNQAYPNCVSLLNTDVLDQMAATYLEKLNALSPEAKHVVDKMPQNFFHLGLIQLMFPNARIIHCVRDPLDTCLSCYFHLFNGHQDFSYDLTSLGQYYRLYMKIMKHWKSVLSLPILEVPYETLVNKTHDSIQAILQFCNLPWEDQCLNFHETDREILTSSYEQVRRPIYQTSVGRHKHYDAYLTPLKLAIGLPISREPDQLEKELLLKRQQGSKLHQQGRLKEAEEIYQAILEQNPNDAEIIQLLGVLSYQQGGYEKAYGLIQQAIALRDDIPNFYNNLGLVCLAMKRPDEAIENYKKAINLYPSSHEAHNNLGIAYQNKGQLIEAEHYFQKAIDLKPDYPDALNNLGSLKQARGLITEAMKLYRSALKINDQYVEAMGNLGNCYRLLRKYNQALSIYKKAMALRPNMPEILYNIGQIQADMGRWEEAEASFKQAMELKPRFVDAISGLAQLYEKRGETQKAFELIQSIMAEGKHNTNLAVTFATVSRKLKRSKEAVEWMESLLDMPLTHSQEQLLHFNLGKLYDDLDQFDKAFHHFQRGNQLQPSHFSRKGFIKDLDDLIATFSPDALKTLPRSEIKTNKPIFIVGMMRSGTTLVEQILASHPLVHGAGELTILNEIAHSIPNNVKNKVSYPKCASQLTQPMVNAMAKVYLDHITKLDPQASYITDKMPQNFYHLGLVQLMFPEVKIIHCMRDPLDTCLSCYFQLFNGSHEYAYDLSNLGFYYRQYEKLMAHWKSTLTLDILDIQYEALIDDFESHARKIVAFCGLEWDDNCLKFYETKRDVKTASYQQVRQPIYHRSVGRYQNYDRFLGPLKEALEKTV